MCGIAGLVAPGRRADDLRTIVGRMTDTIVHRGPDDAGAYCTAGAAIAMRRLSIIDVAGGHQPIANEDGGIQVVLNGEIYNYPDLRRELEAAGHHFQTQSDTETIAHAFEDDGIGAFARLRGMFAVAVWDGVARRLVLARDRLGKKPLYYALTAGGLVFGSEIKALLAADPSLAEPDPAALEPYFRFGFVPEPSTFYRRIELVPPGHTLEWRQGTVVTTAFWRLDVPETFESRPAGEWAEELDALLSESVRIRLMSEVPLGVFLSGGLDSSAVVAYAHAAGLRPVKTFTIAFDSPAWDESGDAAVVARAFETDHHVLRLAEADLVRALPDTLHRIVHHCDAPFGDASAVPTWHVSRLARQQATVILSGDGGDELFAGYTTYQGFKFADAYVRTVPAALRRALPGAIERVARWLPAGRDAAQRAARVTRASGLPFDEQYFNKMSLAPPDILARLLAPEVRAVRPAGLAALHDVLRGPAPAVAKLGHADIRFRLLGDMLVKVDRMSMAHSLEVRSPFLDHRLVEFAARIPPGLKLRGWEKKAILRDVLKPRLPASTLAKKKAGFSLPLREWLRTGLSEAVGDYLLSATSALDDGAVQPAAARALVTAHLRGERDHSSIIWLLLVYAAWRSRSTGGLMATGTLG